MKTIICTAGTSVARGARFQPGQSTESFRQEVRRRQDELRNKTATETYLHAASAETNSVSRLQPDKGDIVWFLHTETDDGEICAGETARLLKQYLALDAVYIFEQSETLLRLPPVPLNFDYERLGQARNALLQLEQATTMPREEFFKMIPGIDYAQREYYASLLEEDEKGEVMLSGFAQMLLYQSRSVDQCEIWMHPRALRSYERSQGLLRQVFDHLLDRVRDPLWRQAKAHAFQSSDIPCFKPEKKHLKSQFKEVSDLALALRRHNEAFQEKINLLQTELRVNESALNYCRLPFWRRWMSPPPRCAPPRN